MTVKEQRRAQVLTGVAGGAVTLKEAACIMGVSLRQARRLKGALMREGPSALAHGNRGRPSPRRLNPALAQAVVEHYRGRYHGLNHQHFTDLLVEREHLAVSVGSVRRLLRAAGFPSPQTRRPPPHRARRERMPAEGMLLQLDGSAHRWLGPGGPKWTLLAAVDDATSDPVAGLFSLEEDAASYIGLLREVVQTKGVPAAVYHDRHSIFRVPGAAGTSLEEDLAGERLPTQVGRLLAELGVTSIPAYSPQAKGRVERPFRTHQDRLVAELRLAGVETLEQANAFLPGYLARYRARFAAPPRSPESAYVPVARETELDRLFCLKYTRKVAPDNTIRFGGQVLQIPPGPERVSYARTIVEVHERLDGSIALYYQGRQLLLVPASGSAAPLRARHRLVHDPAQAALPQVLQEPALDGVAQGPPHPTPTPNTLVRKPAPDHPWRTYRQGGHFH